MIAFLERLAPRERKLLLVAGALLALAVVWWLLLAPALKTLRTSQSQHTQLDLELTKMQALALEAKQLKANPAINPKDAEAWLVQSVKKLGKSTLTLPLGGLQSGSQSGLAQVNLVAVNAAQLAIWLTDARTTAGLMPTEAHWKRTNTNTSAGANIDSAQWSGSVTLKLATAAAP